MTATAEAAAAATAAGSAAGAAAGAAAGVAVAVAGGGGAAGSAMVPYSAIPLFNASNFMAQSSYYPPPPPPAGPRIRAYANSTAPPMPPGIQYKDHAGLSFPSKLPSNAAVIPALGLELAKEALVYNGPDAEPLYESAVSTFQDLTLPALAEGFADPDVSTTDFVSGLLDAKEAAKEAAATIGMITKPAYTDVVSSIARLVANVRRAAAPLRRAAKKSVGGLSGQAVIMAGTRMVSAGGKRF